jgi:hypothetical protein
MSMRADISMTRFANKIPNAMTTPPERQNARPIKQ